MTLELFSSDGHLEVPPDAWTHRLDRRVRPLAPCVVTERSEGRELSVVHLPSGATVPAGRNLGRPGGGAYGSNGSAAPGTGSPDQRVAEQQLDGLAGELLFPPPMLGAIVADLRAVATADEIDATIRAYNDFLRHDYCTADPRRLVGVPVLPPTGTDRALAELDRLADDDEIRTVCLLAHPNGAPTSRRADAPFWRVAEDADLLVSVHKAITRLRVPRPRASDRRSVLMRSLERPTIATFVDLLVSGVFEDHPDLRIYFAETEASWLPAAIDVLDDVVARDAGTTFPPLERLPSDCLGACYFGIVRDPLEHLPRTFPIDHLLWGSDFPHSISTFPRSMEIVTTTYEALGADIIAGLASGTAAALGLWRPRAASSAVPQPPVT